LGQVEIFNAQSEPALIQYEILEYKLVFI
jgi:hypothetical protein